METLGNLNDKEKIGERRRETDSKE